LILDELASKKQNDRSSNTEVKTAGQSVSNEVHWLVSYQFASNQIDVILRFNLGCYVGSIECSSLTNLVEKKNQQEENYIENKPWRRKTPQHLPHGLQSFLIHDVLPDEKARSIKGWLLAMADSLGSHSIGKSQDLCRKHILLSRCWTACRTTSNICMQQM
jgi:hypothetical protein